MARKNGHSQVLPEESHEEMTVVIFKLKGHSSTLQKGFDAINTAFTSFGAVLPSSTRRIASAAVVKDGASILADEVEENGDGETEAQGNSDVIEANPKTTSKPKSAPRAKPKFLADFNLNQSDTSWKDFATARTAKNESEKYLLASLWVTENSGMPEFTVAHIFTCFRAMSWHEQADFSQPMRSLKSKKSYFTMVGKKWKLTGPGLEAARSIKAA